MVTEKCKYFSGRLLTQLVEVLKYLFHLKTPTHNTVNGQVTQTNMLTCPLYRLLELKSLEDLPNSRAHDQ